MKWSRPIESWALIAIFSSSVSGIGLVFHSASWRMLVDVGMLPLVGCMTIISWRVPLILLSSVLFLFLNCLLIRLSFHCSGIVVLLSPSIESWFMMVVVGVEIVVTPLLSCIELEGVLVFRCFWMVRSWWNGSSILELEFSFDSRLAILKQASSDSDDVTSLRDISLRRGFEWCDTLEWPEIEDSSAVFCTLSWSIILRLPCFVLVLSTESLLES